MDFETKQKEIQKEWIRVRAGRVVMEHALRTDSSADKAVLTRKIAQAKELEYIFEDMERGLIQEHQFEQRLKKERIEIITKDLAKLRKRIIRVEAASGYDKVTIESKLRTARIIEAQMVELLDDLRKPQE
jgi:hypothetical protein